MMPLKRMDGTRPHSTATCQVVHVPARVWRLSDASRLPRGGQWARVDRSGDSSWSN